LPPGSSPRGGGGGKKGGLEQRRNTKGEKRKLWGSSPLQEKQKREPFQTKRRSWRHPFADKGKKSRTGLVRTRLGKRSPSHATAVLCSEKKKKKGGNGVHVTFGKKKRQSTVEAPLHRKGERRVKERTGRVGVIAVF